MSIALTVLSGSVGCGGGSASSEAEPSDGPGLFVEVAQEVGLDFVYRNGAGGDLLLAEIMGSGAALLDYDRDGDLDVLLLQGASFEDGSSGSSRGSSAQEKAMGASLFRNELMESGELHFTDVTQVSGLDARGHAMGATVGDVDNDGWPDLYLTFYGSNQLWRNRGDGGFELAPAVSTADAAADAVETTRWSTAASFFDYDRDGWLDLYVVDYLVYSPESDPPCVDISGRPDYCRPTEFPSAPDRLFHNRGDGTFEEVTAAAGIGRPGAGLGSLALDADDDGWLDLFVANDGEPNFLWRNRGDGTFEETAVPAGAAVNRDGQPEASMGLAAGDFDGDGAEDFFITHLALETATLYRRLGPGLYDDATAAADLTEITWKLTGFGAAALDYDLDGDLDLMQVNGGVERVPDLTTLYAERPLAMPNQLFENRGDGRFREVSRRAGGGLQEREVSRGLAVGDLDNDGDADALITNNDGPVRLLLNQASEKGSWVGLRLVETGGRDALGAQVEVRFIDGSTALRRVRTDGSYLSASDPRLLFGLGDGAVPEEAQVTWVDGTGEIFAVEAGRYQELQRGAGRPVSGSAGGDS
ncbi:MAG: CRTAC1 family protein [Acidobacteriota bacterium]|nr:CRTAC1 family protein [Acidobacteriota bacterium]